MITKLLERLWNERLTLWGLMSARETRDSEHERQIRREEAIEAQRGRQQRVSEKRKEDHADTEMLLTLLLVSEEFRRALEEFTKEIDDDIRTIRLVYNRAHADLDQAREALEHARVNAITLVGGRRVYFTADGHRLYSEGRREITDNTLVAEARRRGSTGSTSFEEYVRREDRFVEANALVQSLSDALNRFDDIQTRLKDGNLSHQDLERFRQEEQQIIESLPADSRVEFDRLREAARKVDSPAYRGLDADAEGAFTLTARFTKAGHSLTQEDQKNPEGTPDRAPAYKGVPEF